MSHPEDRRAVEALVTTARDAVALFRANCERGVSVDPEFRRALQRLHLACEVVESRDGQG